MIQGTRILLALLLAGFLRLAGLPPAEAIEHTEGNGRNGKEVHRRDGFPVISKKASVLLAPGLSELVSSSGKSFVPRYRNRA